MKVELKVKQTFEISHLQVDAGVRYWEDATVNGVEDSVGDLIPCRDGDRWKPLINIDTGEILDWDSGTEAEIHYKVCDDGLYTLIDDKGNPLAEVDGYVPNIMCPTAGNDGDYIIMHINGDGKIKNWNNDISDFLEDDE